MTKVKLTRAEWLSRNKALPVALIQKPLRFIREKTSSTVPELDSKGNDTGRRVQVDSPQYKFAYEAASYGYGSYVQNMARSVLQGAM